MITSYLLIILFVLYVAIGGIGFYIIFIGWPVTKQKNMTKLPDYEVKRIASAMCRANGEDPASQPGWKYYEKNARLWLGAMKSYEDSKHDH